MMDRNHIRRVSESMDFDLSDIRMPSLFIPPGMENDLSFIPEMIEYSSNAHVT